MKAFLTGSRVYGNPNDDSDIDLVIRVDRETKEKLIELAGGGSVVRFGKLNLLICATDQEYWAWQDGTEELVERLNEKLERTEREEAITVFKGYRELYQVALTQYPEGTKL